MPHEKQTIWCMYPLLCGLRMQFLVRCCLDLQKVHRGWSPLTPAFPFPPCGAWSPVAAPPVASGAWFLALAPQLLVVLGSSHWLPHLLVVLGSPQRFLPLLVGLGSLPHGSSHKGCPGKLLDLLATAEMLHLAGTARAGRTAQMGENSLVAGTIRIGPLLGDHQDTETEEQIK